MLSERIQQGRKGSRMEQGKRPQCDLRWPYLELCNVNYIRVVSPGNTWPTVGVLWRLREKLLSIFRRGGSRSLRTTGRWMSMSSKYLARATRVPTLVSQVWVFQGSGHKMADCEKPKDDNIASPRETVWIISKRCPGPPPANHVFFNMWSFLIHCQILVKLEHS